MCITEHYEADPLRMTRLYELEFARYLRGELAQKYCYGCKVNHTSQTYQLLV